jgi:hypothetical protein
MTDKTAPEQEAPLTDRYRVEAAEGGFWPCVVRCGNGTRVLFRGSRKNAEIVARECQTAFLDGQFAALASAPQPKAEQEAINAKTVERFHHALAKHGWHPGRTDEPIADCVERALAAGRIGPYPIKRAALTPPPKGTRPLTEPASEPVAWLWTGHNGNVQAFTSKPPPSMLADPQCQPLYLSAPRPLVSEPPADMLLVPRALVVDVESRIADEWGEDTDDGKALNAILHGRAPAGLSPAPSITPERDATGYYPVDDSNDSDRPAPDASSTVAPADAEDTARGDSKPPP